MPRRGRILYQNAVNRAHPLNRGLMAWWLPLMNNQGGLRLRDIAGGYHGTLTNGPTWAAGANGFAALAHVSGSDTYVSVGTIPFGASGTLVWSQYPLDAHNSGTTAGRTMWGRSDLSGAFGAQVFSDNNWYVGWDSGNRVTLAASATNWVINQWNHYVYTWGASSNVLYHQGKSIGSAGGVTTSSVSFGLGSYRYGVTLSFDGRQDSFRWLDRQISADEAWGEYQQWQHGFPDLLNRVSRRVAKVPAAGGGGTALLPMMMQNGLYVGSAR